MSWVAELAGGARPRAPPQDPKEPKVQDPSIPNRMVSAKTANQPFLVHKEYRNKQEALHNAWLEKKKEHDAKIARGETVGKLEPDPTAEHEIGFVGLLKFVVYLLLFTMLAGKFFTGSYLWEYEGRWAQLKTYMPANQRLFSERTLAGFDGSDPDRPVYLAIDHDVYDVSSSRRTYGPGGSYHLMAGTDAARSFATGCFKTHRTHDIRGLSESEQRGLDHWKKFFAEHKSYVKVGRVSHPPIDPASPIPEPCNQKNDVDSAKKPTKESQGHPDDKKQDKKILEHDRKEL